jgi:hypothetical protein
MRCVNTQDPFGLGIFLFVPESFPEFVAGFAARFLTKFLLSFASTSPRGALATRQAPTRASRPQE